MAELVGVTSGVLTLVLFALDSSRELYRVIKSFQSNNRYIRELKEELEALNGVLQSLRDTASDTGINLTALERPLERCGKACEEFGEVINRRTTHSGGSRTSFRDWAKLTYMGDDIAGFKHMIAGYKATITIALGDANIRATAVTIKVLNEYKELIANTKSDLEEHLQQMDQKLQSLSEQGAGISNGNEEEQRQMQEERDSAQQCLEICAEVSAHIDQIQFKAFDNVSAATDEQRILTQGDSLVSAQLTQNSLTECKKELDNTTRLLTRRLQDINDQLRQSLQGRGVTDEHAAETVRIQQELASVKECLNICALADEKAATHRTNVFEDVSMADDGHQIIVATLGDLISAKRVTAGNRSTQWLGQMSDASLQELSQNRGGRIGDEEVKPNTEDNVRSDGPWKGPGRTISVSDLKE